MPLASRRLALGTASVALVAGVATLAVAAPAAPSAAAAPGAGVVQLLVLSGRADLVTGGDAYVRAVVPRGPDPATLRLDVGGRDVTSAFAQRDGGLEGVVTGLSLGDNVLRARVPDGRAATLTLKSSPIGGPGLIRRRSRAPR